MARKFEPESRAEKSRRSPEQWVCVCAFAKSVQETDPYAFPRVGLATNVLYRCSLIIEHKATGVRAIQPPTLACCPRHFKEPKDHAICAQEGEE